MAVSVSGNNNTLVYGKGDVCLRINPFDNFRMFTLYEDWRSDEHKPIDLSGGQKIYLVFKSKNKEIRIPEYDAIENEYTVDKVNGQVLFKISKKNATDILSLNSNIFYITRLYSLGEAYDKNEISSNEEVLFVGQWREEGDGSIEGYTSQIKNLTAMLEEKNKQIKNLQASNAQLMAQNADFAVQIETLQNDNDKMSAQITDLETKVADYESGTEYTGTVIDDNAQHVIISRVGNVNNGKEYTEGQLAAALKSLEETSQN